MNCSALTKALLLPALVALSAAASVQAQQSTPAKDALLQGLAPPDWEQAGEIEHYGVQDLYLKIDGRSEMYMGYDVAGLSFVSFSNPADKGQFIDVFAYDMSGPTGAFGVYAVEREPGQPKIALGRAGYRSDANYYFWKGQYYVYVQSSDSGPAIEKAALGVARGVAGRLTDSGEPVKGIEWLPKQGLQADTVQYFKFDAMSLDFLTETFTGRYRIGDRTATFFVSKRASDADAESIRKQFIEYMTGYGENVEGTTVDGVEITLANMGGGYYDAIFRIGDTVAGLTAIEGHAPALQTAKHELSLFKAHIAANQPDTK